MNDFLKIFAIHLWAVVLVTSNFGCGRVQARLYRGGPNSLTAPSGETYAISIEGRTGVVGSAGVYYDSFISPPTELEILAGEPGMYAKLEMGEQVCSYVDAGDRMELDHCSSASPTIVMAGDVIYLSVVGSENAAVKVHLQLNVE